jgi:prepilin signal peptidase PulO-like enzyme (type II secretory pathway)
MNGGIGRNWQRLALWAFLSAVLVYLLVVPLIQNWMGQLFYDREMTRFPPRPLAELFFQRAVEVVLGFIFFCFGASIGSFLNVVAHRMPLQKSIASEPSHCPGCGNRILARDNVPVFGWLWLEGKCRHCQAPISPRYPIVEGIVGLVFFLLFARELALGGSNLPFRNVRFGGGWDAGLQAITWELVAIFVYHCAWFVFLITWALFAWDGNRVPKRALTFAVFVLALPPLVWNFLIIVPYPTLIFFPLREPLRAGFLNAELTVLLGALSGVALSWAFSVPLRAWVNGFQPSLSNRILVMPLTDLPSTDIDSGAKRSEELESAGSHAVFPDPLAEAVERSGDKPDLFPEAAGLLREPDRLPLPTGAADESKVSSEEEVSLETPVLAVRPKELNAEMLDRSYRDSVSAAIFCTGLAVGWQALLAIASITLLIRAACLTLRSVNVWESIPFVTWFAIAALIHHLSWQSLYPAL